MIDEFEKLKDNEIESLLKAPLLVCILIAGADGTIDKKEIREAISFAQKQTKSQSLLAGYFGEVSQDFEDKLKILIQGYPYESTQRNPLIIQELQDLNNVLPKLSKTFALALYNILKSIAEKIATSSGGLLGLKSIGNEEARLINLPMINNPGSWFRIYS